MAGSKVKTSAEATQTGTGHGLKKWLTLGVALLLLRITCSWLDAIKHRWYVFEPATLHKLAQEAVASAPHPEDINHMIQHIVSNLTENYPKSQIRLNTNSSEWMFNNAGGAMGAMYIIHASITEYLIIFGTPLGTEGHTGIHPVDNYFNILVGEEWAFHPPKLEKEVYPPGSVHHLPRGHFKQYKMHEGCFALEYSRGWIPLMLPFGFADMFLSTLDYITVIRTARITAREMLGNLLIGKI
ncbi:ERG2 and sigma1 receptor-like protein [Panus rudis PR-1116 ss-1]|nr:ERG2 and sigma1 receptor-like protein [Panus rudis PR-1116 ss-1]